MNYVDIFFIILAIAVTIFAILNVKGYKNVKKKSVDNDKSEDNQEHIKWLWQFKSPLNTQNNSKMRSLNEGKINSIISNSAGFIENVIHYFYDGNKEELRKITSKNIFSMLEAELDKKNINEIRKLDRVKNIIIKTGEKNNSNEIVLQFESQQIAYEKNSKGSVIKGDDNKFIDVVDCWIVDVSNYENWKLKEIVKICE